MQLLCINNSTLRCIYNESQAECGYRKKESEKVYYHRRKISREHKTTIKTTFRLAGSNRGQNKTKLVQKGVLTTNTNQVRRGGSKGKLQFSK